MNSEKHTTLKTRVSAILFGLIIILFFFTIRNLVMPLFFGAVFAIVLYPIFLRAVRAFRGRRGAAAIFTVIASLIVFGALVYVIGSFVFRDALHLVDNISDQIDPLAGKARETYTSLQAWLPPQIADQLGQVDLKSQIVGAFKGVAQGILNYLQSFATNFASLLGLGLITIYSTVYLMVNGEKWNQRFFRLFPLPAGDEEYLSTRFVVMTKVALRTVFVMGALNGFLGGLIFFLLGIPSPFFWGLVFALMSIIPSVGSAFVWLPTTVILLVMGEPIKALILLLYGVIIMGFSDDVVRPFLVGKSSELHPFLILISTLGGIATFGFPGLIIGPVVAALAAAVLNLYEKRIAG